MDCPKCAQPTLKESLGPRGVAVDLCKRCYGIWFDKGEIYSYVRDQERVYDFLREAYQETKDSQRKCPRCTTAMREVELKDAGIVIEACSTCGGNWFDEGEIVQLNRTLGTGINPQEPDYIQAVESSWQAAARGDKPSPRPESAAQTLTFAAAGDASWKAMAGAPLAALPDLALRSWGTLAALYGVLTAFMFVIVFYLKVDMDYAFAFGALGIVLQFLLAPYLTDLSLSWLYKMRWHQPAELPPFLREFIAEAFAKEKVAFPRVGIIEDGSPNAFTYGHYPGDARLVFTRGLLDILDEDEAKAVAAHEIGHVMHWDMAVMTMAALVPFILYYLYRLFRDLSNSRSRSSSSKKGNPFPLLMIIAYVLYLITQYLVLFLSRVREYYADRYAGEITQMPNKMATALVKIAYGLAGRRKSKQEKEEGAPPAVKSLGIFDAASAKAMVAASLGAEKNVSTENLLGAMQWDLWNPWAMYYEFSSTHPLTAKRIQRLGEQAASCGQRPLVLFNLEQPESYWDDFFVDLFYAWLPLIFVAAVGCFHFLSGREMPTQPAWLVYVAALCMGYIGKTMFSCRTGFFPEMSVSALLKRVKVSKVRGVPATIEGTVIGRGVPGYIFSEDLVLQDQTGFIFIDYEQPLAVFELLFAITKGPRLIDQKVMVEGWYRRGPVPFFEVRRIHHREGVSTCWTLEAKYVLAGLFLALSLLCGLGILGTF